MARPGGVRAHPASSTELGEENMNAAMQHIICCYAVTPGVFAGIPDYIGFQELNKHEELQT
jgi:hypothetical protein